MTRFHVFRHHFPVLECLFLLCPFCPVSRPGFWLSRCPEKLHCCVLLETLDFDCKAKKTIFYLGVFPLSAKFCHPTGT